MQVVLQQPLEKLASYPMPPADRPVVGVLTAPGRYLVTPEPLPAERAGFLARLERALDAGIRRVQLRAREWPAATLPDLARDVAHRCRLRGARSQGVTMSLIASIVVALVALLHIYFLVLEMFLWDKPAGLKAFGQTPASAAATKVLAANQGLYNGFLAAGLLWGLWLGPEGFGVKVFFLLCVLIAGLYGAATASRKILYVQALPAAVGLVLVVLSRGA